MIVGFEIAVLLGMQLTANTNAPLTPPVGPPLTVLVMDNTPDVGNRGLVTVTTALPSAVTNTGLPVYVSAPQAYWLGALASTVSVTVHDACAGRLFTVLEAETPLATLTSAANVPSTPQLMSKLNVPLIRPTAALGPVNCLVTVTAPVRRCSVLVTLIVMGVEVPSGPAGLGLIVGVPAQA